MARPSTIALHDKIKFRKNQSKVIYPDCPSPSHDINEISDQYVHSFSEIYPF